MGWKLEQLELIGIDRVKHNEERDVHIVLEEEKRAVIHGIVTFPNGKPVKGAVVKLFHKKGSKECTGECDLIPITFTFTDESGRFLFGVESEKDYVILVYFYKSEKPMLPQERIDIEHLDLL